MKNNIEKRIELKAPVSKVWKALTDHKQFGEWFGVNLEGPFEAGKTTKGMMTIPGYETKKFLANVQTLEPETYFAYTWHPCADNPEYDYTDETPTLVEFRLEAIDGGTVLNVVETGFDKLPNNRREEAHRRNSEGWVAQLENIEEYVTEKSASGC